MAFSKIYGLGLLAVIFAALHASDSLSQKKMAICLSAHNRLRALHKNTPPLEWDDSIAAKAQQYAEHLLAMHQGRTDTMLVHDKNKNGLGENLYWSDKAKPGTCAKASLSWYNEIDDYDYANARSKNGKAVGHFTQLVWKETIKFGVGIATGKSRIYAQYGNVETFIVAKYSPQGNFHWRGHRLRDYSANVQPRLTGAVTPSLADLDPATNQKKACKNALGDRKCSQILSKPKFSCIGKYKLYFEKKCNKQCGYC